MPQASFFAFAHSYDLDPDGAYFVARTRPLNGSGTPLPSSQSMPSNVASMVLTVASPVTKPPVHPRGELYWAVPPIRPGRPAVGVNTMVDVVVTGIKVF